MTIAFIGLGSNLGDREGACVRAVREVGRLPHTGRLRCSRWYATSPVGGGRQPEFLNAVIAVETGLSARRLHRALQGIERRLGRLRGRRWGPRAIDLDLLYYGSERIRDPDLHVPHRRRASRRFVMDPMVDLAPEFVDPVQHRTVRAIRDARLPRWAGQRVRRLRTPPVWAFFRRGS